jgi:microcystin-dependent protein
MRSNIQSDDFDSTGKGESLDLQGWALCNGQNNTVDLRSRFIVAHDERTIQPSGVDEWDLNYKVGNKGGEKTTILTVNQMPAHNHTGNSINAGDVGLIRRTQAGENKTCSSLDSINSGDEPDATSIPKPIPSQGEGEAHNNTPAYFTLAFIQRV